MEYVQERITTLHALTDRTPDAPAGRAAVVVPMTEHEHATLAAERVLAELEDVAPGRVVVALRASTDRVAEFREWLDGYDLPLDLLWCSGPRLGDLLDAHGLGGDVGKGRDVWLALGVAAANHPYVVCHDADTASYRADYVTRLLFPLERGFEFSKGYYARVENDRLYGRLFRLFYAPLLRALRDRHEAPVLAYLASFRYALAGEFAATAELARTLRVERRFGLEVGTLGDAFDRAGFEGSAQVDLGRYAHDHRAVGGPTGLADMSDDVGAAVLRIVENAGIDPEYPTLRDAYRTVALRLIDQYGADAAFNGLEYDEGEERSQVEAYATSIRSPADDDRLPAWQDAPVTPDEVLAVARKDLNAA